MTRFGGSFGDPLDGGVCRPDVTSSGCTARRALGTPPPLAGERIWSTLGTSIPRHRERSAAADDARGLPHSGDYHQLRRFPGPRGGRPRLPALGAARQPRGLIFRRTLWFRRR